MRSLALCLLLAGCTGASGVSPEAETPPRRLAAVVASGYIVTPPQQIPPEVRQTVSETTYRIEGATVPEINASMRERSPFRDAATREGPDGYTAWDIRWAFDSRFRDGECRVENLEVRLSIETTTYAWDPPPGVAPEVTRAVRQAQARLLAHEREHQTINLLGAMDVADALGALTRPTCQRLEEDARKAGMRVLDDLAAVNRAFDIATQSGTVAPPGARD